MRVLVSVDGAGKVLLYSVEGYPYHLGASAKPLVDNPPQDVAALFGSATARPKTGRF